MQTDESQRSRRAGGRNKSVNGRVGGRVYPCRVRADGAACKYGEGFLSKQQPVDKKRKRAYTLMSELPEGRGNLHGHEAEVSLWESSPARLIESFYL